MTKLVTCISFSMGTMEMEYCWLLRWIDWEEQLNKQALKMNFKFTAMLFWTDNPSFLRIVNSIL